MTKTGFFSFCKKIVASLEDIWVASVGTRIHAAVKQTRTECFRLYLLLFQSSFWSCYAVNSIIKDEEFVIPYPTWPL